MPISALTTASVHQNAMHVFDIREIFEDQECCLSMCIKTSSIATFVISSVFFSFILQVKTYTLCVLATDSSRFRLTIFKFDPF